MVDRLFEMGFESQLREIIHRLADKRQTLLFSATLPKLLMEFAKAGLHDPTLIRLDVDNKLSPNLQVRESQHCKQGNGSTASKETAALQVRKPQHCK